MNEQQYKESLGKCEKLGKIPTFTLDSQHRSTETTSMGTVNN